MRISIALTRAFAPDGDDHELLAFARAVAARGHECQVEVLALRNATVFEEWLSALHARATSHATRHGHQSLDIDGVAVGVWSRALPTVFCPVGFRAALFKLVRDMLETMLASRLPDALVLAQGGEMLAAWDALAPRNAHPRTVAWLRTDAEIAALPKKLDRRLRPATSRAASSRLLRDLLILDESTLDPFETWVEGAARDIESWKGRVRESATRPQEREDALQFTLDEGPQE